MISIEYLQIAQNAARSRSRCQSSPMSTPVELCRKTWKETASLQLVLGVKTEQMIPFSPWIESHDLPLVTASSPFGLAPFKILEFFFFFYFRSLLPSFPFDFLSSSRLLLPILTLILTPLAVSCLCHQVPRFQMLTLASATFQEWWCITRRMDLLQHSENSHRDFRHYWHGLTFITVEESQKCIKEVCFQSSYSLILVNGCGCFENLVS